jgi:hypothetical protein
MIRTCSRPTRSVSTSTASAADDLVDVLTEAPALLTLKTAQVLSLEN